jgi:hypothetical protein
MCSPIQPIHATSHYSLLVSSFTLSLWLHLTRIDPSRTHPAITALHGPLLDLLQSISLRPGDPDAGFLDGPRAPFLDADFSSAEEFNAFFSTFRSTIMDIVRAVAQTAPGIVSGLDEFPSPHV